MARSVDIQNVVAKTQAVERLYQAQKQHPETEQRQFALDVQHKVEEKQRMAQPSPKSDKVEIHRDKEKKEEQKKSAQKKKKNPTKLESDLDKGHLVKISELNGGRGRIVDIKV